MNSKGEGASPSFVSPTCPFSRKLWNCRKKSFRELGLGRRMVESCGCIIASHTKLFLPTASSSPPLRSSLGLRATVHRLFCSPSQNFHFPVVASLSFAPNTQQGFLQQIISSDLWGSARDSTALAQLNPILAPFQFRMGTLPIHGREVAQGPPVWDPFEMPPL